MNVLYIPSWYPYPAEPHAGQFFIDQATFLAEHNVAHISVLNWGQNEFQIKLKKPLSSLVRLHRYLGSQPHKERLTDNLTIITVPHLTWTHHLLKGNIQALIPKLKDIPKPDLIHAQVSFPAGYLAMELSKSYSVPFIITEHSGPFPLPNFMQPNGMSSLVRLPLMAASKVVAVSSHLQAQIYTHTGITAQVIPNLVDTDFYFPLSNPFPNRIFRLFAMSALTEPKGIKNLINAVTQLVIRGCEFQLYLAGSGPLKTWLHRQISTHRLRKYIFPLGTLNRNQALYQYHKCDSFIMPSHVESFSMVLVEAMACGKPVIATTCGGPEDIVDERCGMLIPAFSPDSIADAILTMQSTIDSYSSRFIRQHCLDKFSPQVVTFQIAHMYQSCLP